MIAPGEFPKSRDYIQVYHIREVVFKHVQELMRAAKYSHDLGKNSENKPRPAI